VQVNWYLSACHTIVRFRIRADSPAHLATSLSTFEGQKGALAIRECACVIHAAK
jgi:hypothetical protein